jgi:hypothetical protein
MLPYKVIQNNLNFPHKPQSTLNAFASLHNLTVFIIDAAAELQLFNFSLTEKTTAGKDHHALTSRHRARAVHTSQRHEGSNFIRQLA